MAVLDFFGIPLIKVDLLGLLKNAQQFLMCSRITGSIDRFQNFSEESSTAASGFNIILPPNTMFTSVLGLGGRWLIRILSTSFGSQLNAHAFPGPYAGGICGAARQLQEPYRMIVMIAGCLGLRISEMLGLQGRDVDWGK